LRTIITTKQIKKDWTFLEYSTKEFTHGFHQYPARMHPEIAKRLITKYASDAKSVVFDPFMGSGGVLVEAVIHGNNSIGIDVNPFAVLLSKVKTTPIEPSKLRNRHEKLMSIAKQDFENHVNYNNAPKSINLPFWYTKDSLEKLQILKNHILKIKDPNMRDFFKICFSLTTRRVSYQRNSIYKIYRMKPEKRESFNPNTFSVFESISNKNIDNMKNFFNIDFNAKAFPLLGDTRNAVDEFKKIPQEILDDGKSHLLVTSPPYGDHDTTVAYGQFSRHPGLWLEIPEEKELLEIDSVGLGGRKKKEVIDLESPLLDNILKIIAEKDKQVTKKTNLSNRAHDVYAYFNDLDRCFDQISQILKKGDSYCCFVVANRRVRRETIPTDEICVELAKKYGFKHKYTTYRTIANKAMAVKNAPENIAQFSDSTMNEESIVVWKY